MKADSCSCFVKGERACPGFTALLARLVLHPLLSSLPCFCCFHTLASISRRGQRSRREVRSAAPGRGVWIAERKAVIFVSINEKRLAEADLSCLLSSVLSSREAQTLPSQRHIFTFLFFLFFCSSPVLLFSHLCRVPAVAFGCYMGSSPLFPLKPLRHAGRRLLWITFPSWDIKGLLVLQGHGSWSFLQRINLRSTFTPRFRPPAVKTRGRPHSILNTNWLLSSRGTLVFVPLSPATPLFTPQYCSNIHYFLGGRQATGFTPASLVVRLVLLTFGRGLDLLPRYKL